MKGGIRLDCKKDASLVSWTIKRLFPPPKVRIPIEESAEVCVCLGEHVRIGECIAEPVAADAVAVHASISGEITGIGKWTHPLRGECLAVEIHADGRDEYLPEIGQIRHGWSELASEQILDLLRNYGVVTMDESMKSLSARIRQQTGRKVHTLVLNGCESEPYLTCEYSLAMTHATEILKGAEILRSLLAAEKVIVASEDHKLEAAELLKSKIYFLKWNRYQVKVLPARYPQGDETLLLESLFKSDGADQKGAQSSGAFLCNFSTAYAVYEAVVLQKPLYERVVTMGGGCIAESKNIWAPVGISFKDAVKACKGLLREPRKVVMNGPMQGFAQPDLDRPVIKGTQAVLALPREVAMTRRPSACIRCNRCAAACPAGISPATITLAAERGLLKIAVSENIASCIECGNCSYVCPAKRPMIELMRAVKAILRLPVRHPMVTVRPKTGLPEDIPYLHKEEVPARMSSKGI